jgi:periplasmic protein TonB
MHISQSGIRILVLVSIFLPLLSFAQTETNLPDVPSAPRITVQGDTTIFTNVEIDASFYHNNAGLETYINNRIKSVRDSLKLNQHDSVTVRLVVEKDGTVSQPSVVKATDTVLSRQSLEIIKKMPRWRPAQFDGRAVRSYRTFIMVW